MSYCQQCTDLQRENKRLREALAWQDRNGGDGCPFSTLNHGIKHDQPCPVCGVGATASFDEIDRACVTPARRRLLPEGA